MRKRTYGQLSRDTTYSDKQGLKELKREFNIQPSQKPENAKAALKSLTTPSGEDPGNG